MSNAEYLSSLRKKVADWDESIKQLETAASKADSPAKEEYFMQIADIKEKRESVSSLLRKIEGSSGQNWDDLIQKLSDTVHNLETMIANALSK